MTGRSIPFHNPLPRGGQRGNLGTMNHKGIGRGGRGALARAAFLLCLALSPDILASGYYVPGVGIKPLGRGTATTVSSDDATAAWHNPARLAAIQGTSLLVDAAWVALESTFKRSGASFTPARSYPMVSSQRGPFLIPFFGISSDFGTRRVTVSASVYGPFSWMAAYPADGPQRYAQVSSQVLQILYQLSAAVRITDSLYLGATFQLSDVRVFKEFQISFALPGLIGNDAEDPAADALVKLDLADHFVPRPTFGVWWAPLPWLQAGLAFSPPITADTAGVLSIPQADMQRLSQLNAELAGFELRGDKITASFSLPALLRAGIRYVHRRFDVEFNLIYEFWSGMKTVVVDPTQVKFYTHSRGEMTVDPMNMNLQFSNAFSLRLGSDFKVVPGAFTLRAGYFFEKAAAPSEWFDIGTVDSDKHGLTFGMTFKWRWLELSFALAFIFQKTRDIGNSKGRQINVLYPALGTTINDGVYKSSYIMGGLGLRLLFFGPKRKR